MSDSTKSTVDLTPKPILTISAHEAVIYGIAYLLDGEQLVTCSYDGMVKVWNVENGEQEGTSMEHGGWVRAVAVTKDCKWILGGGEENRLMVWDGETHQAKAEWGGHENNICCIAPSPDGQLVASGDEGGRIIIREMSEEGGEINHSIETGNSSRAQQSAFSWKPWKALSRISFVRSNDPPVTRTPIYPGYAPYRTSTYAPPRPAETTTQTVTDPTSTATGATAAYSVITLDSSDSPDDAEDNQPSEATPGPQHNSDDVQVSCCALFTRRRGRFSTASALPAIGLIERTARPSNATPPVAASPHSPPPQNILDLPAVVKLPDHVPDHGLNDVNRELELQVERERSKNETLQRQLEVMAEDMATIKRQLAASGTASMQGPSR
ncbi:WD40-repeat-containing domain protein [Melanogaster broomeanus]|nr:WD40-repeat-containing domain protein [Melanogaster broomeanus]